jgi:3-dehydroquinate synthase/shikimate kinase/3-dehydroquinate synthase
VIVLIGFMGSGKTTVARMLAARLGAPYVDTDRLVEECAGKPIAEIFDQDGEAAFRALERSAVADALSGGDAVVSVGGGAPVDPGTRDLLGSHQVVWLEVSLDTALTRARSGGDRRPLLDEGDPAELHERRRGIYAELADLSVPTDGRSPTEIVDELMRSLGPEHGDATPRRIRVSTPGAPYTVVVGRGVAHEVSEHVSLPAAAEKAFLITHPSLVPHAGAVIDSLGRSGLDVRVLTMPEGESSKSIDTATRLHRELAEGRAHRDDLVVSFGGGVVCDVGGFVASTYMRGIAHVVIPTTLLAQVDAAIGGKTGVNLDEAKNLVGTIHQPIAVLCDVDLLATCPPEETRSGLAEVVKAGFIADPSILELVRSGVDRIVALDPDLLVDLIARSVAVKASVVASDERERGDRAFLNYGHTFAHAIESVSGLGRIRHGEAVALGMMAAAYTAEGIGWIDDEVVRLHADVLSAIGLPVGAELEFDALSEAWTKDKKYRKGVRLVLLRGLGRPVTGVRVPPEVLKEAIARLARED